MKLLDCNFRGITGNQGVGCTESLTVRFLVHLGMRISTRSCLSSPLYISAQEGFQYTTEFVLTSTSVPKDLKYTRECIFPAPFEKNRSQVHYSNATQMGTHTEGREGNDQMILRKLTSQFVVFR